MTHMYLRMCSSHSTHLSLLVSNPLHVSWKDVHVCSIRLKFIWSRVCVICKYTIRKEELDILHSKLGFDMHVLYYAGRILFPKSQMASLHLCRMKRLITWIETIIFGDPSILVVCRRLSDLPKIISIRSVNNMIVRRKSRNPLLIEIVVKFSMFHQTCSTFICFYLKFSS